MTVPDASNSDAVKAWVTVDAVRRNPLAAAALLLALLARAEAAEAERDALRTEVQRWRRVSDEFARALRLTGSDEYRAILAAYSNVRAQQEEEW